MNPSLQEPTETVYEGLRLSKYFDRDIALRYPLFMFVCALWVTLLILAVIVFLKLDESQDKKQEEKKKENSKKAQESSSFSAGSILKSKEFWMLFLMYSFLNGTVNFLSMNVKSFGLEFVTDSF